MDIKPLFDRVLLTPFVEEHSSQLIAPKEEEGNKMIVLSVGTNPNFIVQKDDIVLINEYSGYKFTNNNNSYILVKECDILAILHKEKK